MGKGKKPAPGPASGSHAKERHKRDRRGGRYLDPSAPVPPDLVVRRERPQISSKHKSWFEFIENKDKKKKLEIEFTTNVEPPPGFEFVPIGNPALTKACKELSREKDAMIFIVTDGIGESEHFSRHVDRVGHHIRQSIVEEARSTLSEDELKGLSSNPLVPEPIPESQDEINRQADAAIRDLFPRIPNTDRQAIIEHAFNKSASEEDVKNGKDSRVGLASHLPLSKRVQLAVLAHIRHNHTRYDDLLQEKKAPYAMVRKAVMPVCLDILLKWRGDEETGRDQLDEILCEVIEISDSESEESDESDEDDGSDDDEESSESSSVEEIPADRAAVDERPAARVTIAPLGALPASRPANNVGVEERSRASHAPQKVTKSSTQDKRAAKWSRRGFNRYQAVLDEALERRRQQQAQEAFQPDGAVRSVDDPQSWSSADRSRPDPSWTGRGSAEPSYHAHRSYGTPLPVGVEPSGYGSRVGEWQQPLVAREPYRASPMATIRETPPPRTRPLLAAPAEVERVSYQGQDLKDYLVPSIEHASPESSPFSRFQAPSRRPEPIVLHHSERLAEVTQARAHISMETRPAAQPSHAAFAGEGFIRLPPRPEAGRAAPEHRAEPFILLNPQPAKREEARSAVPPSSGASMRQPSAWADGAPARPHESRAPSAWVDQDGRILRSEARPIVIGGVYSPARTHEPRASSAWVDSDGRALRLEGNPIVIDDAYSPPPPRRAEHERVPMGGRVAAPDNWTDPRQTGLGLAGHQRQVLSSGTDHRADTLRDGVEIIPVSNKFPRQHDGRPSPVTTGYDSRPMAALQQPYIRPLQSIARSLPEPEPLRVEHVPNSVGGARMADTSVPLSAAHGPARYPIKQERVVAVEYVHVHESVDPRRYAEHRSVYGATTAAHSPPSIYTAPAAHSGPLPQQSQIIRPVPRRD
ncbi:hypothetical protein VTJ49DRAFT_2795 [Mycothermus thermophilus]|uniref:DUF2293 domain-containing protein n=1 Tax=Humicola insolens TaxID=85995 RepID=A0ABR3V920_HUMIN